MTKEQIITTLAKGRKVEQMVENIAHQPLSQDLKDLSQMVYLILLEYDEAKIIDLWENHQMDFFLARIIVNQYHSVNSPYYTQFRKFRSLADTEIHWQGTEDEEDFDIFDTDRVI